MLLSHPYRIGPETNTLRNKVQEDYQSNKEDLDSKKEKIQKEIDSISENIKYSLDQYTKFKEKREHYGEAVDCSDIIASIRYMLNKEHLDDAEYIKLQNDVEEIEQLKMTIGREVLGTTNNLWTMARIYREYQEFRYLYFETIDQIMDTQVIDNAYEEAQTSIQDLAQVLLNSLPDTGYIFKSNEGEDIKTKVFSMGNLYGKLVQIRISSTVDMGDVEAGLRIFIDNKIVGITCALMALFIDIMILFVGIILPPDVDFEATTYTSEDKKRIMANLFNKPIGR